MGLFPTKKAKPKVREVTAVAAVIRAKEGCFLARRAGDGLLGGLWEPVFGECAEDEAPDQAVRRVTRERAGLSGGVFTPVGKVAHAFSHQRLRVTVYVATETDHAHARPGDGYSDLRWVGDLESVGLSTLARKLLAAGS